MNQNTNQWGDAVSEAAFVSASNASRELKLFIRKITKNCNCELHEGKRLELYLVDKNKVKITIALQNTNVNARNNQKVFEFLQDACLEISDQPDVITTAHVNCLEIDISGQVFYLVMTSMTI